MKAILLIAVSVLSTLAASAQLKGFGIGPYAELGWPKGKLADRVSGGFGAGIAADVKLPGKFSAMGSVGLLRFSNKNSGSESEGPLTATPMRFGLKYRLPLVYLKMESGVAKIKNEKDPLILSPGIGIRLLGLDVQASYETWLRQPGSSFARLRVGYLF